jgi:hypothetical protein
MAISRVRCEGSIAGIYSMISRFSAGYPVTTRLMFIGVSLPLIFAVPEKLYLNVN